MDNTEIIKRLEKEIDTINENTRLNCTDYDMGYLAGLEKAHGIITDLINKD